MRSAERFDDPLAVLRIVSKSTASTIWTAMPGYIVDFDTQKITATIQLGITGKVGQSDGSVSIVNLPLLVGVPVCFPRGGGSTLTFPIASGDECLVVFASRASDAWKQSGGIQSPSDVRMHDLSDGFAIVGPMSQGKKISNVSATTTQLRSDDGSTYVELDSSGQIVNVTAPGGFNVIGPATFSSTVTAAENIKSSGGDVLAGAISLTNHAHGGVESGSDLTGPPEG